jgi:hypothetical protein
MEMTRRWEFGGWSSIDPPDLAVLMLVVGRKLASWLGFEAPPDR